MTENQPLSIQLPENGPKLNLRFLSKSKRAPVIKDFSRAQKKQYDEAIQSFKSVISHAKGTQAFVSEDKQSHLKDCDRLKGLMLQPAFDIYGKMIDFPIYKNMETEFYQEQKFPQSFIIAQKMAYELESKLSYETRDSISADGSPLSYSQEDYEQEFAVYFKIIDDFIHKIVTEERECQYFSSSFMIDKPNAFTSMSIILMKFFKMYKSCKTWAEAKDLLGEYFNMNTLLDLEINSPFEGEEIMDSR